MGVTATYLAADPDGSLDDGGVRPGLFCGRAGAELDQSTPRYWPNNLCAGLNASNRRMVGTLEGEREEENVHPIEINGTHQGHSSLLDPRNLTYVFSFING